MSDITEAVTAYLKTSADLTNYHIGEDVPHEVDYPYVWLMRSGEILSEELCHPPSIEAVTIDVEIVSDDIDEARTVTADLKQFLAIAAIHSISYTNEAGDTQTIHAFTVEDHDDNYLPRNLDQDQRLHIGALNITILLGDIATA